jgi:hypothetical protein
MRSAFAVLLSAVVAVAGCGNDLGKGSAAVASASATPTQPLLVSPPPAPPPPPPADLVLEPMVRELGCGKKSTSAPCRILQDFAVGTRWAPKLPSGEGRWVGSATVREKGVERQDVMILWAKIVPTSQISPGELPMRVGFGTVGEDIREHAFKMIRSLGRGDSPSPRNQARVFVESFVPTVHRGAVNTAAASVQLISEELVYLRQSGRKVLVLMPSRQVSATPGDGTYAELWVSTW